LDIFVDPFASEVDGVCFLKESKLCEASEAPVRQLKSAALLFFNNKTSAEQFKDLYNNMQLPSYRYPT
jgi:flagellar biosynthesis regulator FlbT